MLALAWGKLIINLNNAVNALSGRTLIDQLGNRDYRRVVAASMRDISRTVRRMAEGTEESTTAVRELTALSERFSDLMGTFRTG